VVIPWEAERWIGGGAMNLATGVFTIPANGRYYFFSFNAVAAKTKASNYTSTFAYTRISSLRLAIMALFITTNFWAFFSRKIFLQIYFIICRGELLMAFFNEFNEVT